MSELETSMKFGIHGACVMVENKKVQHYDIQVDSRRKEVSCWIESKAEKAFTIVWMELDVPFTSSCKLFIDGRFAEEYFRLRGDRAPIEIDDGIVSESSSAPFIFGASIVTDDDRYLDNVNSIGEIKLDVFRASRPMKIRNNKGAVNVEPPHEGKIHEQSKKEIAHRVKYGTKVPTMIANRYLMDDLEILVTFIFKYRSLEILRANGIVPGKPEPKENDFHRSETSTGKEEDCKVKMEAESGPETDDSDSDEDSSDDDTLRESLKALLAETERIKKEIRKRKKLKDRRLKKKFKKEEKPVFTPGEIIDFKLT